MPLARPAKAPIAAKKPHSHTHHGVTVEDPYAWLRAENWQEVMRKPEVLDKEIRAYLEAENAYADEALKPLDGLRETLFTEIRGRIKEDDSSVPAKDGDWYYFRKFETGAQHPLDCRARDAAGKDGVEVLLDGNKEAEGEAYFKLGGLSHTRDHKMLAWAADRKGSEFFTIHFRDLTRGKDLDYTVPDTSGDPVWALDNETLFYTKLDDNHRPCQVYRHRVGTDPAADVLVYEESDPGFFVGVSETQDSAFILISTHDHQTAETWLIDARDPASKPRCVEPRRAGIEYDVEHDGPRGRFLIHTNDADAEDFKIVEAPVEAPGAANWEDVVPHQAGIYIIGQLLYRDHHLRIERKDGLKRIVIRTLETGAEQIIGFEEEAYDLDLHGGYEYATTNVRFAYSSMTTPAEIYDYDIAAGTRVLRKRQEIPSGHDPKLYETRRLFATAKDGERIPISILYRKGTPLDGSAPLYLYGYGSYGITMDPHFSAGVLSLVDRGFVHAVAHIRGGKEGGYRWYRMGKTTAKKNTFEDFIAVAEHLAAEKYTARGNIVAHGGSAGGMLMGAVANMAPDLFKGIIAEVAFVDVLNTMLDETLPLTPPEWLEWGNPIEDEEAYSYIASYSPYDQVGAQAYPNILAIAGLTDPRVTYWEPAKWVARLRDLKTDDNALLLKTNMEAGHGGASGRFERLKEVALVYAFALAVAGKA